MWLLVDLNRKLCGLVVRELHRRTELGLSPGFAVFHLQAG